MANLIWIGPGDGSNRKPHIEEGIATEAITPGSVLNHAAANAGFELSDVAGTTIGEQFIVADKKTYGEVTVSTAWTATETMQAILPRSGEYLNVLVVTGQALVKGTPLMRSGSGGTLTIATPLDGTDVIEIVAYSDEIKTTSGTELVRVYVK